MSRTLIASASREVIIGFDQPFRMIGEKINPTNRPKFMAELRDNCFDTVLSDALLQAAAGADILDVNVGVPLADEPALLREAVLRIQAVCDVPLCIDSSVMAALEAALPVYQGRALVNSVTGEEESLERMLPLVKKYDAAVVAISNDESGISMDLDVRFEVAKKIVQRAADHGIKAQDVVVDPLVMPLGAVNGAGADAFKLVRRLREELGVNTICGASNVGFGLPERHALTATFIAMAAGAGMTSAIMGVTHVEMIRAVRAANALNGYDENCRTWIKMARGDAPSEGRVERKRRREG